MIFLFALQMEICNLWEDEMSFDTQKRINIFSFFKRQTKKKRRQIVLLFHHPSINMVLEFTTNALMSIAQAAVNDTGGNAVQFDSFCGRDGFSFVCYVVKKASEMFLMLISQALLTLFYDTQT